MAAELQAIAFREYLPALLGGTEHIPPYQGYNKSVNVGMSNIMATAAFRLSHIITQRTSRVHIFTQHVTILKGDLHGTAFSHATDL